MLTCEHCGRSCPAHKWGKIKAHGEGWFLLMDGRAYCPEHVPDWVAAWRARQVDQP